uniref:Uncharacterized protein n=1 Tax=Siphoviridae sp. ctwQT14 TaxID=2827971 RepID=A0A8S5TK72_9CAUD|nr:MAG TPA: hypothetical protein [Siphoviridae sp. ctwQT14]
MYCKLFAEEKQFKLSNIITIIKTIAFLKIVLLPY